MKFHIAFMLKFVFTIASVAWFVYCSASEVGGSSTSLEINGIYYSNACEPSANESLRKIVLMSGVENSNQAWLAMHALLCGSFNSTDYDIVRAIVPVKIREKNFYTGEDLTFRILKRDEKVIKDLMAGGKAWGARVRVASKSIVLKYYPNDVCIRHVTLENSASKWHVSEIGEACD